MPRPWPFPQDTALDRARSVARSFADALREHAPGAAEALTAQAREFGEGWVAVRQYAPAGSGELCTEEEVARRLGVSRSTVRNMIDRGLGPGSKQGQGRKLMRYPGGIDPGEAEALRRWARAQTHTPRRVDGRARCATVTP